MRYLGPTATEDTEVPTHKQVVDQMDATISRRRYPKFSCDFLATNSASFAPFFLTAVSSGTFTTPSGVVSADHPGVQRITSSTTANSGAYLTTGTGSIILGAGDTFDAVVKFVSFSNTTSRIGFHDATTFSDAVDGAYFELTTITGVTTFKTSRNSTRTVGSGSYSPVVGTWYRFNVFVNSTSLVTGTIYDMSGNVLFQTTCESNIPTTASRECGPGLISTNSGTTATAMTDVDYISYERVGTAMVR